MTLSNNILITGSAGFIGFSLSNYLLKNNYNVIGIDSINDYYDVELKKKRHSILNKKNN
ncbi:MAG: NAD-dependent epimerase/dehydratase family protein, partial [Flavobacteriaceae bacterium]